jgi:hypothetical protein
MWGVQLIGNAWQSAALAAFTNANASILGSHEPLALLWSALHDFSW